jgi:hypothetical protein
MVTDELGTAPAAGELLEAFRLHSGADLRPVADGCTAYAGWLSSVWPKLDSEERSLLLDVGALLHASASAHGQTPGSIRGALEQLFLQNLK